MHNAPNEPEREQEYPLHQSQDTNRHERSRPFDAQTDDDFIEKTQAVEPPTMQRTVRQRPVRQHDEDDTVALPRNRLKNASIAGLIAGVLCSIESIIIAFSNTANYQQAASIPAAKLPVNLAFTLVEIACLTYFIGLLICLIAGFVVGKVAVQRRYGFLTGFIAGIVTYGISFLLNYIPNYPGHLPGSSTNNASIILGGIFVVLIVFLITGIIAGLVSLFGTWFATRRHPYYVGY